MNFRCASYDQFKIGEKTYFHDELGCLSEHLASNRVDSTRKAIETTKKCGPDDESKIYEVKVGPNLVYESCFDKEEVKTYWTRYLVQPFSTPGDRPDVGFITNGLPNTFQYNKAYMKVSCM